MPTLILGDLPIRQFEAGHAIGGDYACLCGVDLNALPNAENLFVTGPYLTMEDRMKALGSVNIAEQSLDRMKVCCKGQLVMDIRHRLMYIS